MQPTPTTTNSPVGNRHLLLTILLIVGALLSAYIQWEYCQLTGTTLLFGQSIVQLVLTVFLLSLWFQPPPRWLVILQFFTSFGVLVLCGLLINESYILWYEGGTIQTNAALPAILLGTGGAFVLSRLFLAIADDHFPPTGRLLVSVFFPALAAGLAVVFIMMYFTGWLWLDRLGAVFAASTTALVATFFLIDGYWNLIEAK